MAIQGVRPLKGFGMIVLYEGAHTYLSVVTACICRERISSLPSRTAAVQGKNSQHPGVLRFFLPHFATVYQALVQGLGQNMFLYMGPKRR